MNYDFSNLLKNAEVKLLSKANDFYMNVRHILISPMLNKSIDTL